NAKNPIILENQSVRNLFLDWIVKFLFGFFSNLPHLVTWLYGGKVKDVFKAPTTLRVLVLCFLHGLTLLPPSEPQQHRFYGRAESGICRPTTLPARHSDAENHTVNSHHFLCLKELPWTFCHCGCDRAYLPTEQEQMSKRRKYVGLQSLNLKFS
ncbi:hypothetical protein AMECASPLE_024520, partial [Ameca splendens]